VPTLFSSYGLSYHFPEIHLRGWATNFILAFEASGVARICVEGGIIFLGREGSVCFCLCVSYSEPCIGLAYSVISNLRHTWVHIWCTFDVISTIQWALMERCKREVGGGSPAEIISLYRFGPPYDHWRPRFSSVCLYRLLSSFIAGDATVPNHFKSNFGHWLEKFQDPNSRRPPGHLPLASATGFLALLYTAVVCYEHIRLLRFRELAV